MPNPTAPNNASLGHHHHHHYRPVRPCRALVYSVCSCLLNSAPRGPSERVIDLGRAFGRYAVLLAVTGFFLSHSTSALQAQEAAGERIFFHAQVFTANPKNPYAAAVAIRGDKILAVGNLPEVAKSVSPNAERIDLEGKTLFPGFIDSHSHSIDGGLGLIAADASEKVTTLDELPPFAAAAKTSGKGMRGDILEILGLPLAFWSHPDVLNADFSSSAYAHQSLLPRGMDGPPAWANRTLLQRAGINADF